jgi:hypothetical protein
MTTTGDAKPGSISGPGARATGLRADPRGGHGSDRDDRRAGPGLQGGPLRAVEVVQDVRARVLAAVQQSAAFGENGATVTVRR